MFRTYAKGPANNALFIAITRMGDLLQASPTIMGMKEENPHGKITVITERNFTEICEGIPGIDEIISIDLAYVCRCLYQEHEGIVDAYRYVSESIDQLRGRKFDYVLNMSSSGYSALIMKLLDIPESRGWISDDEGFRIINNPWSMLFAAFIFHNNRDYNSMNLVDIVRCTAGVEKHPHSLNYRVPEEQAAFAKSFLAEHGISEGGPLICVQAGASQDKRQWAPRHFAALTKMLVENLNARVVYTGSPSEQQIIENIETHYASPRAVSACGRTNLPQLGALLKEADLLITGDTGTMHLSVAVGTPTVSVFLASALAFETGPYGPGHIVVQPQVSCNPCNPNLPCARPDCHEQVTPGMVAHLAKLRLETPMGNEAEIRLPASMFPARQAQVYYTKFDEDGFIDLAPITPDHGREGYPMGYLAIARNAYRSLWKEEFQVGSQNVLSETHRPEENRTMLRGCLEKIIMLTERGAAELNVLENAVCDVSIPASRIGEINTTLLHVDQELETIGLTYPILGALIRMFIMQKENIRGDDPLHLASEMRELYAVLERRSRCFAHAFQLHS